MKTDDATSIDVAIHGDAANVATVSNENTATAIEIKNLSVTRGKKQLFENFNLTVNKNQSVSLLAPSGGGKTTLLFLMAGLKMENCAKTSGEIFVSGEGHAASKVSVLFQEPRLIPNVSVLKNIMLPLENIMEEKLANERAARFAEHVNLSEKINSFPHQLSGGERQRVAIARAFAFPSDVLLMDEPFQSQDLRTKNKLFALIKQLLAEEKRTVFFVTHDVDEAVALSDRVIVMDGSPLSVQLDVQNLAKNTAPHAANASDFFQGGRDNLNAGVDFDIVSKIKNILRQ